MPDKRGSQAVWECSSRTHSAGLSLLPGRRLHYRMRAYCLSSAPMGSRSVWERGWETEGEENGHRERSCGDLRKGEGARGRGVFRVIDLGRVRSP